MVLTLHLATGVATNPQEIAEWTASPAGKAFVGRSGEFWRAAHVAGGEDPTAAKTQSDRTIAFFRGETAPDIAHPGTGS